MKRKAILLSCALSLVMSATFAQKIKVKGSVTDDKGNKLSGVTITEKGTSNATATNPSGGFELNAETGKTLILIL
ncbi:carboxypeptidase-like regulatory domain-containing protein [Sphingobacterium sp. KU25419]|nr:carboxypeptidase-like regulatory domain-containing protein [Sphingobacterium sp. KU25419]